MEQRIKNLEIEIAYLRKSIEELIDYVLDLQLINYNLTTIKLSEEYLTKHPEIFKK